MCKHTEVCRALNELLDREVGNGLIAYDEAYREVEALDPDHKPQIHASRRDEAHATCSCGWKSHLTEGDPLARDEAILHIWRSTKAAA